VGDASLAKCIQGANLSTIAVQTNGWTINPGAHTDYPTYGYETTETGKPLSLQVNTNTNDGRPATVNLYFTEADKGIGNYQIS